MKLPITSVSIMNLFFMLGVTVILAADKNLFNRSGVEIYEFLLRVFPQVYYAVISFLIVIILFSSFILRNRTLEIIGLFFSGIFTLFVLAGHLLTFPNIGSVAFSVWTLSSFMTIVEIINIKQDEKEACEREALKQSIIDRENTFKGGE